MDPKVSFTGPNWFCVVVEQNRHRQVEAFLAAMGCRTFVPRVKKWVSHARVRKAVERPLIGRYLFVEVDYPRQSFAPVRAARGVQDIVSHLGVPCVMPRADVEDFLERYLLGEFDEVTGKPVPIGARVAIVEGKFDNWLATVTGRQKGGGLTVKLLGRNVHLGKLPVSSVRPATGFDLERGNPDLAAV